MDSKLEIGFWRLFHEATVARSHFHTWWALRNIALPEYYETMNEYEYVDFFHVSNSGNYKLVFIALAKLLDRTDKSFGLTALREGLAIEKLDQLAYQIENISTQHNETVRKVRNIRNQSIAHNENDLRRAEVYEFNEITPDEIRDLIDCICAALNTVAEHLGSSNVISDGERFENSVLKMLKTLSKGRA